METNPAATQVSNAVPERQPEVSNEMGKLTTQCEVLSKQLDELETRLVKVLALRSENASANPTGSPEPVRVPLAQAIHDHVRLLSGLSEQLKSIINRVEL